MSIGALLRLTGLVAFMIVALGTLPRPIAQFVLLPVIVGVAWRVRLFSVRIPTVVLGAACIGALVGAVFRFSNVTLSRGAFLVAKLSDQDLQQETKIYRDKMRRVLGADNDALVGLHSKRITTMTEARWLLDRSPQLGGVVWGSMRWMTASLQTYAPLSFSSFGSSSAAQDYLARYALPDLLISRSISSVSLSHGDERASIAFLAGTSKLWRDVPYAVAPGHDRPEFDSMAVGLARMRARWTSHAHLAFPLWLAGTRHLVRALEQPELEFGELRCAIARLKQAIKQCRGRDNPHLEAAARSNYALALLMYADSSPKRERFRKAALRHMRSAARWRKRQVDGALAAAHNIEALGAKTTGVKINAKRKR
jgi:hypothetical protein